MDNAKKSLPESVKIENFTVKKLTLEDYVIALDKAGKIFAVFKNFDNLDEKTIFANLGKIISQALPDVVEILAIATDEKPETIKKIDALTLIKLLRAFFKVNDFFLILEEIKTMQAER